MAAKKTDTETTDTPEVAPSPTGDNAGTGAPNAVPEAQTEAAAAAVEEATGLSTDDKDPTVAADAAEKTSALAQRLGDLGVTPQPHWVNGVDVRGKKLNEKTGVYEDDPDAVEAPARTSDIFDRIAAASPNEGVRMVLEEIARFAGMTSDNTQELPAGTTGSASTGGKSTASIRKDLGDTATSAPSVAEG